MTQRPGLETERLFLRPFLMSDAKDVQRLAGDREVAEPTSAVPHPYEDGMAEEWISTHQEGFDSGRSVSFAITLKACGSLLGAISLLNMSADRHRAELGYWVGKEFWNRGYGTESARAVIGYGFAGLQLNRIHGRCLRRNPGSGRVLEKAGMQYEGCQRAHECRGGEFEDVMLYGVLRSDWIGAGNAPGYENVSTRKNPLLRWLRIPAWQEREQK